MKKCLSKQMTQNAHVAVQLVKQFTLAYSRFLLIHLPKVVHFSQKRRANSVQYELLQTNLYLPVIHLNSTYPTSCFSKGGISNRIAS